MAEVFEEVLVITRMSRVARYAGVSVDAPVRTKVTPGKLALTSRFLKLARKLPVATLHSPPREASNPPMVSVVPEAGWMMVPLAQRLTDTHAVPSFLLG
jgi:hypothetical protein